MADRFSKLPVIASSFSPWFEFCVFHVIFLAFLMIVPSNITLFPVCAVLYDKRASSMRRTRRFES